MLNKKGFIWAVTIALLLSGITLFAQSDRDDPTPPTTPAPEITPNPDGSEVYVQVINNAPGMWEYRWFNQDFDWTHTFDPEGKRILSATLEIAAWDVDYYYGERDVIYADGQLLGNLQGANYSWSITSFNVSAELLSDGMLNVFINIDSTHTRYWWAVTIGWSKLTVVYETIEIKSIQDAIEVLDSMRQHLPAIMPAGIGTSLSAKLDAAVTAIIATNFTAAINQLEAAKNELEALASKIIANTTVSEKTRILDDLIFFFQGQAELPEFKHVKLFAFGFARPFVPTITSIEGVKGAFYIIEAEKVVKFDLELHRTYNTKCGKIFFYRPAKGEVTQQSSVILDGGKLAVPIPVVIHLEKKKDCSCKKLAFLQLVNSKLIEIDAAGEERVIKTTKDHPTAAGEDIEFALDTTFMKLDDPTYPRLQNVESGVSLLNAPGLNQDPETQP